MEKKREKVRDALGVRCFDCLVFTLYTSLSMEETKSLLWERRLMNEAFLVPASGVNVAKE